MTKKRVSQETTDAISSRLKNTAEQRNVVGPLVKYLVSVGWKLDQIIFGKAEWRIPKTPSQATRREKGQRFEGFPVDIAVFDSTNQTGNPRHLLFIVECKQPDETAGISQLEAYFVGEPHAKLGIWANSPDPSATAAFLYRQHDRALLKRRKVNDLPRPGEAIKPEAQRLAFNDLIEPTELILKRTVEDLLDKVVMTDSNVTRREEQLDQLCNLMLLKLESDKQAKSDRASPVSFRPRESHARTAEAMRDRFEQFVDLYPEVFTTDKDRALRFNDETIAACVEELSGLKLIDLGVSTIALAFQVLRSEALKQNEGQYFTPRAVIEAGVRLMNIRWEDIVLDPACGTGGFLVEVMVDMQRRNPGMSKEELSRWAQTHIFGVEKDAIGVKLTKAIMQIAGDGSAHCVRGDSIRTHNWARDFPHLCDPKFKDKRFTAIITNPPFGLNLKVSAEDARLAGLDLARVGNSTYADLEIGLLFLQRAHKWLKTGGRVGIVLPETYFFSSNYEFLFRWIKPRFRPIVVANVPIGGVSRILPREDQLLCFREDRRGQKMKKVAFLNPRTCGIYKDGGPRYKTDVATGRRTDIIDNELIEHVEAYLAGRSPAGYVSVPVRHVFDRRVLVPTYYDQRYADPLRALLKRLKVDPVTLGELIDKGMIRVRGGHGSPGNDQRTGHIPYVKVSDIRGLRININPTNLVTDSVAKRFWRGSQSGLEAWDLITPNRASSNIGEFAILLPGEEQVVLTKEVFVLRVAKSALFDAFYLLWALSLKAVRDQWRRVALMQTNREDCGERYREVMLPKPRSREWARTVSAPFRNYFQTVADGKTEFLDAVGHDGFDYVANVRSLNPVAPLEQTELDIGQ